ncbi:MAG: hypothetical protein ACYTGH_07240, partial [Planctomycetota bacterium]
DDLTELDNRFFVSEANYKCSNQQDWNSTFTIFFLLGLTFYSTDLQNTGGKYSGIGVARLT